MERNNIYLFFIIKFINIKKLSIIKYNYFKNCYFFYFKI